MRSWRNPKLSVFFWIAAAAWCGVLFFLSGQNAVESGALSQFVTRIVLRLFPFLKTSPELLELFLRKCAHFAIFTIEGALLGAAMMTCLPERAVGGLLTVMTCMILAVLNEYHESFIDGRSCEFRDMLIDSGGGVTGVLFAALLLWLGYRIACHRTQQRDNVMIS